MTRIVELAAAHIDVSFEKGASTLSSEKMESSKDENVSEDELSDKDLAKATGGGNTITNVMKMNTENSNNITPNSKAS